MILVIAGELKTEIQRVTRLELEVLSCLLRNKHAISVCGKHGQRGLCVSSREIRIRNARVSDLSRVYPIYILKVISQVSKPVNHGLRGSHAWHSPYFGQLAAQWRLY